jgi:aerobic-type carbon monoxide dehydrogenase small subunit (CoxS/CutS family)
MAQLTLTVNGRPWTGDVRPDASLLELLREQLRLTGPKLGCGEGQCGSCTVIVDGRAVAACTTPALAAAQASIVTVEGLASGERLHPLQQAFLTTQAFQCGFCTAGMITASAALLAVNAAPTDPEIKRALEGHICRCGVYQRIVDAVREAAGVMAREARRG